jgi:aminopeptidase 2
VQAIQEKSKTPTSKRAAMYASYHTSTTICLTFSRRAMCATGDPALINATLNYFLTKARSQDVVFYIVGFSFNPKAKHAVAKFFKDNYDTVRAVCFVQSEVSILSVLGG